MCPKPVCATVRGAPPVLLHDKAVVHFKAFAGQQDAQTAIPEPASFIRQFAQPLAQGFIALILFLILEDRPVQISQFTRPTLRQAVPVHHSPALYIRR